MRKSLYFSIKVDARKPALFIGFVDRYTEFAVYLWPVKLTIGFGY